LVGYFVPKEIPFYPAVNFWVTKNHREKELRLLLPGGNPTFKLGAFTAYLF